MDLAHYAAWRDMLREEALPAAIIDLDAVEQNLRTLLAPTEGTGVSLRLGTKALRCPSLLRHLLAGGMPRIQGLFASTAAEVELLHGLGFDDLLLAYPPSRPAEAQALVRVAAAGALVRVVVDEPAHLTLLGPLAAEAGVTLPVLIDLDLSWSPVGRLSFGARRSPLRNPALAVELARRVADTPGLFPVGLLSYEAQIAGVPDRNAGSRALDPARALIKRQSQAAVLDRRLITVEGLKEAGLPVQVVNGGGTGSLLFTARDPSVTEITVGSGFLAPHLFDHYDGLSLVPACFFALAACRRPDGDHLTAMGGGWIASGPVNEDRAPQVILPAGLRPLPFEGWGEVQTPFRITAPLPAGFSVGDPVIARPAKSGELLDRVCEALFVRGGRVESRAATFRGLGLSSP
jgi:D-serine deaminase-like pyridoxal phosphate-dependent protein